MPLDILVGSYNSRAPMSDAVAGVHRVRLDPEDLATAEVRPWAKARDPSWLAREPGSMDVLAAEERPASDGPRLLRLRRDGTAMVLAFLPGSLTCHLAVSPNGRLVAAAQYGDGSLALVDLWDGTTRVVQLAGSGPVRGRQDGPHAHFVQFQDGGRTLAALDLGNDALHLLAVEEGGLWPVSRLALPPGSGPRHLAASADGSRLYVACELDEGVRLVRRAGRALDLGPVVHPFGVAPQGAGALSAICLSPDERFLMVAGRRQAEIAVLRLEAGTGAPHLAARLSTGGLWPRDLALDPSGQWLVVANERSGTLTLFTRDLRSGSLERIPGAVPVAHPASVLIDAGAAPGGTASML
ncbi:lactonase family protein [Rubellimicrobium rubrum]|uniref:Lactonase family protein n=1 Tax=Rubellimicrobium rubrum TaxID=2585369 RepID=A0A5C4N3U1_9RHOB|nr:beta-propeller fold lactonase family protein [Rubellimicrobium rubrum]TNC51665.1 lactonase family protein [Rubellimicrobium rubrum]